MSQAVDFSAPNPAPDSRPRRPCNACGASIDARAEICPHCGVRQRQSVSKAALLLFAFFLGGIGGHKFYLGKYVQGTLYLLFSWTSIPALIAMVEFVVYAFTSAERLNEKYSADGSLMVVVIALLVGLVFIAGVLAAVALPAYEHYLQRARAASSQVMAPLPPHRDGSGAAAGDARCRAAA